MSEATAIWNIAMGVFKEHSKRLEEDVAAMRRMLEQEFASGNIPRHTRVCEGYQDSEEWQLATDKIQGHIERRAGLIMSGLFMATEEEHLDDRAT